MKPAKSILDSAFRYTPSVKTDIRKTFANARRRIAKEIEAEKASKVTPIKRREKA